MLRGQERQFTERILACPPTQLVENVASDSHETNRYPDPYIFLIDEKKLLTPNSELVEECVDKTSYLGKTEFHAFRKIQNWATENNFGTTVWFSPPFEGRYPVSKVIISEISCSENGTKVLFNRAVVLDIDKNALANLANELSGSNFENPETLRAFPIFPTPQELSNWLDKLANVTTQTQLIETGHDIEKKTETLATIADIKDSIHIVGINSYPSHIYEATYQATREMGLIGKHAGSCPTLTSSTLTPFEAFSESSFSCPRCGGAIASGKGITKCPHCGLTKEEAGSKCG